MNIKTKHERLTHRTIIGLVVLTSLFIYFFTIQVVTIETVNAAESCTGGTTLVSDEVGSVNCKDSLGNICPPGDLVEGSSPGSLRCPTTTSTSNVQCESKLAEDGSVTPEYNQCLKEAELSKLVDFNQGGQNECVYGDNGELISTSIAVECEPGVNPIISYITAIVNFISAGVGIVIIASVMVGGIQYMLAGGNPQVTQAAISRITNAFIALFVFIFMWAFFNWLVPGGILNPDAESTTDTSSQTSAPEFK